MNTQVTLRRCQVTAFKCSKTIMVPTELSLRKALQLCKHIRMHCNDATGCFSISLWIAKERYSYWGWMMGTGVPSTDLADYMRRIIQSSPPTLVPVDFTLEVDGKPVRFELLGRKGIRQEKSSTMATEVTWIDDDGRLIHQCVPLEASEREYHKPNTVRGLQTHNHKKLERAKDIVFNYESSRLELCKQGKENSVLSRRDLRSELGKLTRLVK